MAIDTVSGWIAAMVWVRFARPFLAVRSLASRRPFAERLAAAPSRDEVVAPAVHASAGEHASAAHPTATR